MGRATARVVRFALTPFGAALDRSCVRHLGHSPISWLFARAEGTAYNRPLLLETRGRRTGRLRAVVLPFFPAGPGRICIVGSRGGMPTDPHWARNLRADPQAFILLDRRRFEVEARLVEAGERAQLWELLTRRAPVYQSYAERARGHREIPVFELARRDGAALEAPW